MIRARIGSPDSASAPARDCTSASSTSAHCAAASACPRGDPAGGGHVEQFGQRAGQQYRVLVLYEYGRAGHRHRNARPAPARRAVRTALAAAAAGLCPPSRSASRPASSGSPHTTAVSRPEGTRSPEAGSYSSPKGAGAACPAPAPGTLAESSCRACAPKSARRSAPAPASATASASATATASASATPTASATATAATPASAAADPVPAPATSVRRSASTRAARFAEGREKDQAIAISSKFCSGNIRKATEPYTVDQFADRDPAVECEPGAVPGHADQQQAGQRDLHGGDQRPHPRAVHGGAYAPPARRAR